MAELDPFARDLGYLAKFLDSLRTHSGNLDPIAGQRLLSLLDEEVARWNEIRALLAGAAPEAGGSAAAAAGQAASSAGSAASPGTPAGSRPPAGLTVGSLLDRGPGVPGA